MSMIYKASDWKPGCSVLKAHKQLREFYDKAREDQFSILLDKGLGIPLFFQEEWCEYCLAFVFAQNVALWNGANLRGIYLYHLNSPDVADCLECYQGIMKLNRNKMRKRMMQYSVEVQHTVILLASIVYLFEYPDLNSKEQVRRHRKIEYMIERIYDDSQSCRSTGICDKSRRVDT